MVPLRIACGFGPVGPSAICVITISGSHSAPDGLNRYALVSAIPECDSRWPLTRLFADGLTGSVPAKGGGDSQSGENSVWASSKFCERSSRSLMFLWFRRLRLVQRRTVWCPTLFGTFCIVLLLTSIVAWWCVFGESFLSLTWRMPAAEVLVVEGWIGDQGIRAAATEFEQRGYQYVVATGGLTERRNEPRWSYAEMASRSLIRCGVPNDKIILAPATDVERQRTYESAVAVWKALQARGMQPKALNVFTLGAHARRSRLVFAKVEGPGTKVGVVGWAPPEDEAMPWWRSSERARELLTETAGYVFEALLNSGRGSNSPAVGASSDSVQHPSSTAGPKGG
jgi:uncharacterized SAM-binding protein YcdF (DUF218 family)